MCVYVCAPSSAFLLSNPSPPYLTPPSPPPLPAGTVGRLVADTGLTTHEIEIVALGKKNPAGQLFELRLSRSSPAPVGAVTSKATYGSFAESLLKCHGRGLGVHFV